MRWPELAFVALTALSGVTVAACGPRLGAGAAPSGPAAATGEVWAENLVHPQATAILRAHLDSSGAGDVRVLTRAFYATHADECDFL